MNFQSISENKKDNKLRNREVKKWTLPGDWYAGRLQGYPHIACVQTPPPSDKNLKLKKTKQTNRVTGGRVYTLPTLRAVQSSIVKPKPEWFTDLFTMWREIFLSSTMAKLYEMMTISLLTLLNSKTPI